MKGISARLIICAIAMLLLAVPVFGSSAGPPATQGSDLTAEVGCTCHGGGVPSGDVIVSISGIPKTYNVSTTYNFTITVDSPSAKAAGFLMTDYDAGNFTWADGVGILYSQNMNGTISHSAPNVDKSWIISWTSPSEDNGIIRFALVGNAVNLNDAQDEEDLWSIRYISINPPGSTTDLSGDDLSANTASSGGKEVFNPVEDPNAAEKEHQLQLADDFFNYGNLYYWSTLAIIIAGAIVQREFYERKFGGGPPHLAMELAIPQGIRRGGISLILLFLAIYGFEIWEGYLVAVISFSSLWAGYGVYRTIVQAKAIPVVDEML